MKILIINTSDINGGAARAAYRLHQSLLLENVDSNMLVQSKTSDDFTVLTNGGKIRKYVNKFGFFLDSLPVKFYKNRTKTFFSPSFLAFSNIVDRINKINPDIVHLHWICGGMIKIEELIKIKAPIVWSLHDMWAFTGGCHYDEDCGGFYKACGSCKVLGSTKENDLSKKVYNRKKKVLSQINNMTIVGLSKWLRNCSKNSTLLKDKKHVNLPNPIDTNIFKPFGKEKSREMWNFPKNKKLLLFGAMSKTSDPRKGFKELKYSLCKLDDKNIELIIFGAKKPKDFEDFGFKTHYLGKISDDMNLASLYSAVDVLIVPSLQENLSNQIMESLSCGTPVVGFNIGGNNDMIIHRENGFLAEPFDTNELTRGIVWVIENTNYAKLCKNAREKVLENFDYKIVGKKYIELYGEILNEKQNRNK